MVNYDWKKLAKSVFLAVIIGPNGDALTVKDAGAGEDEASNIFNGEPFRR